MQQVEDRLQQGGAPLGGVVRAPPAAPAAQLTATTGGTPPPEGEEGAARKEWEHGCKCSELWGPWRPYKPTSWADLGEAGWLGCEDAGLWRAMGGGEAPEVKDEREGASTTTTPNPPPLQA